MGSSTSKATRDTARKFRDVPASSITRPPPSRTAPPGTGSPRSAPSRPSARPSGIKDNAIRADSFDPDGLADAAFSNRLRQIGAVQPSPTLSNSSTSSPDPLSSRPGQRRQPMQNTTLSVLEARRRLQQQADAEFDAVGRPGSAGRQFLDVATIREVLVMRSRGSTPADIETHLGLRPGVVASLGPSGVVAAVGGAAG